jgi:hypothetical protein
MTIPARRTSWKRRTISAVQRDHAGRFVPPPIWRGLTGPYWWWYNRARHQAAALFDRRLRDSQEAVEGFRDCHRGQRCFILGNGPSLRDTDLSRLRGEVTFGMNRIYLLFPELGFPTTYYVAVNTLVLEQCAAEVAALDLPRFITWRARRWFPAGPQTLFLDTDYTGPATTGDPTQRYSGLTVTYRAAACLLRAQAGVWIGVDHSPPRAA